MNVEVTSKRKRPLGVTILAVVFLYIGCFGLIVIPIMAATGGVLASLPPMPELAEQWVQAGPLHSFHSYVVLVAWLLGYLLYAAIGFGLWRLKNWARQAVIAICVIGLVVGLCLPIWMRPLTLALAFITLDVLEMGLIWWYVCRARVQQAFGLPVEIHSVKPLDLRGVDSPG